MGRLEYVGADGSARYCSGALIDNSLVLTAAHCIYNPSISNTSSWLQVGPAFVVMVLAFRLLWS